MWIQNVLVEAAAYRLGLPLYRVGGLDMPRTLTPILVFVSKKAKYWHKKGDTSQRDSL